MINTATIIVTAQLEENKAFHNGGEAWVKKFGPKIKFELASDDVMYMSDEDVAEICKEVCKTQSNDLERFTYVAHEVELQKPIEVDVEYYYDQEKGKHIIDTDFDSVKEDELQTLIDGLSDTALNQLWDNVHGGFPTSEEELTYNPVQPLTPHQGKMDNIVAKIENRITAIRKFECAISGDTVQVVTIDGQEICVEK
jgi:hypothetical protein